ncbi:hypothetical protein ABT213_30635 [Streptomyces sp. NPDC001674]|uniref:hypothetical protein n=1 Tax=Streptomyces sp. NPDC001674 TaxID=3154394 RepID=UPI00333428D8
MAELESARHESHHRLRALGSTVLVFVASVLALLAVVAVWANSFIRDTDRYVATVAPLASNPDIQQAVTNRVTTAVLDQAQRCAEVTSRRGARRAEGAQPGFRQRVRRCC